MLTTLVILLLLHFVVAAFVMGKSTAQNGFLFRVTNLFALGVGLCLVLAWGYWSTSKSNANTLFEINFLRLCVVSLIGFMSFVLLRYSIHYLDGDKLRGRYFRSLLITLLCVTVVVLSNHLILFWVSWVGISLSLHRLLVFYPNRPRAALAAHKKFILARLAESALLGAFICIYLTTGSLQVNEISEFYSTYAGAITALDQTAAILLAVVALIKCAQLPVHGWLMQVVESPTPVSALLHAGIINLGGFLVMLFGALVLRVEAAKWLLLIVAGITTLLAALIMTTRISLKVRLAWSTSAQMGLMLVECALGLYELALLHLLAHSAYKAHAFLNASQWVHEDLTRRMSKQVEPPLWQWLGALGVAMGLVYGAASSIGYQGPVSIWTLMIGALTVWLALRFEAQVLRSYWKILGIALVLLVVYSVQKWLLHFMVALPDELRTQAFSASDIWLLTIVITLAIVNYLLYYRAHLPLVQKLSRLLYAGFYLDEWMTRLTILLWPVQLPRTKKQKYLAKHHYTPNLEELK
ncbi:NADH-quinone oxidoreductase subunit L [Pseudoalteromonas sp. J010]|uniref:NADH-quinone oxidoreductase subunit L n=1 Tax=Pseudoalteromonas sp. J010 TaxID=998465 RepID=UPI000F6533B1|nr:NADH-quinone oxidoreductase subunit L [Pseudoalteromonas sp. J010]RRS10711.1 NADH-quinone oxidoreductase subunit L [Pseudoalteromonas sp. J010]